MLKTIEWIPAQPGHPVPGYVRLIDQTRLPGKITYLETTDVQEIWDAIKVLKVRGAPAIGIAAAMGMAVAAQQSDATSTAACLQDTQTAGDYLATSRPTAINLFWAIDRMKRVAQAHAELELNAFIDRLVMEARAIRDEDEAQCRAIGEHGVAFLAECRGVMTHCNAGSLATACYGTALAPMYVANERGQQLTVYAGETRPLLQGARLTAWELMQAGIDVILIADNMAAHVMQAGRIDAVMVGADRIAANGDTANKIGTYGLATLARAHDIPFYVLAPTTTFDFETETGVDIPIEERADSEITEGFGSRTAPDGVQVYSPAFDVTPATLVSAIICEHGVAHPDYRASLAEMAGRTSTPEG
jgi:methylthioribose-1-phosphate isomerase